MNAHEYIQNTEPNGINGWIDLFARTYKTFILLKTGQAPAEWCREKFGRYSTWRREQGSGIYVYDTVRKWDYGGDGKYVLFAFSEEVSDNDLIEFKLRFG